MLIRSTLLALAAVSALSGAALSQTATAEETFIRAQPTDVLSYNLIGLNVTNAGNENIGEIRDLILSNGKLAGYILSVGGFLGIGERYVVVSPGAVAVTYVESEQKWRAKMNATNDQLKAAPEFKYEGRWKR